MDQVLRNTQPTIQLDIADGNGNPLDPDSGFEGLVAVSIADSAGAVVVAGTATNDPSAVGRFTFIVPVANTAILDVYTVTWTAHIGGADQKFTTQFEIVGGFIVSVAEIRQLSTDLQDTAQFPTADIVRARQVAEDRMEQECGVAFRPRGARYIFDGNNELDLYLPNTNPRAIIAATLDSGNGMGPIALTSPQLADIKVDPSGRITRQYLGLWTIGRRNVVVLYEHGLTVAPAPVKRATKILARAELVDSAVPDRAMSFSTSEGTFRLATAGRDGPTGIPYVDAVIESYSQRIPTVGQPEPDPLGRSRANVSTGINSWWNR